jgi:glycosyltransferase involved in cell wall biosynthesis
MTVLIIQTHVQEYRLAVFDELFRRAGRGLCVYSGAESFTPTRGVAAQNRLWHKPLRNHFFFNKRLLWQSGHMSAALSSEICVLEFNPRILSNWIILLIRRFLGLETVVWGHLFPRAGEQAHTRLVRFYMLLFATKINLYTYEEVAQLRKVFRRKQANVSPNAVMWARECIVGNGIRRRLLFVARLIEEKKPLLLLEAFSLAVAKISPDVKLDFIGSGPLEQMLRNRICELRLTDRVTLHGPIYDIQQLSGFYAEALVAFSPGYVGLSATQAFGFGVPLLFAREDLHSVEISLCELGFNSDSFRSDDPVALSKAIVSFAVQPPHWATKHQDICDRLKRTYTLDEMCSGFMRLFEPALRSYSPLNAPVHVSIAWMGLPYYAARVVQEAQKRHPEWRFTVISSHDSIPYKGIDKMVGGSVHWIDSNKDISWKDLNEPYPDLFVITSWPHRAFRRLAEEAKSRNSTHIVTMVDNYLRYTLKQVAGSFYFRLVLRNLYSAAWVPGRYSRRFMEFLGADPTAIYEGLYAADHDVFSPPDSSHDRRGIIYAGQLVARKGITTLIEALNSLRSTAEQPDIRFVGHGPLRSKIEAAGYPVDPFQQPAELAEFYRRANALILPSRIDHWGVVAHEAALCGCLLLVTRQSGCSAELVSHRLNGYVMESCSVHEIISAYRWLESLDQGAIEAARIESLRLARAISPARWADTLDQLVERFVVPERRAVPEG